MSRSSLRKILLQRTVPVFLLLLVVCAVLAEVWLPRILEPRLEKRFSRRLAAEVKIEGFSFGLITGAEMEKLTLRLPGKKNNPGAPVVRLSRLRIEHKPAALLKGNYRLKRVHIQNVRARFNSKIKKWAAQLQFFAQPSFSFPRLKIAQGSLRLNLPFFNRTLPIHDLHLSAWPTAAGRISAMTRLVAAGNSVRLQFDFFPDSGYIKSDIHMPDLNFSTWPAISRAGLNFKPGKLRLQGSLTGNFAGYLPSAARHRQADITGQISLHDLSGKYREWPFRLTNGTADFRLTDHSLVFRDGTLNAAGGSLEISSGGLTFTPRKIKSGWLRAEVRAFDLTSLNDTRINKHFPAASPFHIKSGRLAGGIHVRWAPAKGLTYTAELKGRDISGTIGNNLPKIKELQAEIALSSADGVLIRRAWARLLEGRVDVSGSFELAQGDLCRPHIRFQLTDVAQKQKIVNLLPAGVQKAITLSGIKNAAASGQIALNDQDLKVDITVNAPSAALPDLPFSLGDLVTQLHWASGTGRVVFKNFQAHMRGSPVEGEGKLRFRKGVSADFQLRGRYLPLNNDLLQWLTFDMEKWRAKGAYDIVLRAKDWAPRGSITQSLPGLQAQIELRDVRLSSPELGVVAQHVNSHATLDAHGFQLTQLRGRLFGLKLRGSARLPLHKTGRRSRLEMKTKNIALDSALFRRLPFATSRLKDLNIRGLFSLQAELDGWANPAKPLDGHVAAVIHHLKISPRQTPVTTSGTARFHVSGENIQKLQIEGKANLNELEVGPLAGDHLTADFTCQKGKLHFPKISAGAYGGKIKAEGTTFNLPENTWETTLNVAHVDFESLMGAFGIRGRETPSGVLRSRVEIKGEGLNPEALAGQGTIKVNRGRLYSFPILISVLSLLDLQLPSQSPVTDAYAVLKMEDGKMKIKDLIFTGGSLPVHLKGEAALTVGVPLKHQQINFLITVAKARGWLNKIPGINWLKHYTVDLLRRLVFQARVTGTFADYDIHVRSRPLTTPVREMWSLMEKLSPSPPGEN